MSEIPELVSERLRLRGWLASDADAVRRIYGDPATMRYIGDGSPMPPDRAWHALAFLLGHWAMRGYGMWAVTERSTGILLGRAGLYSPEGWPGLELGWLIERSRWGEGFATEAARLVAEWVWDSLDTDRLIHLIQLAAAYDQTSAAPVRAVVLDFTELAYLNSGGIGLLVTLLVRAQRGGHELRAFGLTDHYRQIFELTRLDEAIMLHDDEAGALA